MRTLMRGGELVDLDGPNAGWHKSSRSGGNGACVEVAEGDAKVAVRDSKDPTGPVLLFTNDVWQGFIAAVQAGQLDRC